MTPPEDLDIWCRSSVVYGVPYVLYLYSAVFLQGSRNSMYICNGVKVVFLRSVEQVVNPIAIVTSSSITYLLGMQSVIWN
ncbi:uncharacterized protein F4817DRAFT_324931 [Daldinia loculata]|uniref:uncharacterized protein n=1 Tax=Daldinia loculata TaxID=103429 RepID=UPI0020C446EC|nr:uncharacterized protein F4817DRAFT_324931 [Daldinia loculata]KAI1651565.1 hypothetical protein F4817DRAFT_324931 [Daldinia loculata]